MALVKIGQIGNYVSISEQKVRQLMKDGIWKEGEHYYKNRHLGHTLFDIDVIVVWVKGAEPKSKAILDLAKRMAS